MKDLDRDIRETLQTAADVAAPEGYHDELEARVAARLEVQEMRGMDMSGANGSGDRTEPPPQGPAEGKSATTAKDEDSGLIDIKNMARSTRRRVTARHSTASDVEESLLASSRPSALRDVVLPEPGKEQPVTLATATEADAEPEPAERKGGGAWMLAVAAVVLIGGGAAAFFALRGGGDNADEARLAAGEAAGERGAAMTPPAAAGADDQAPAEPGAIAADLTDESDDAAGDTAAELGEADDGDAETSGDEPADDDGADEATDDTARRDRGGKSRARKASDSNGKRRDRDAKKSDSGTSADKRDRKDDGNKDSAKEAKPDKPKGKDLDSLLDFAAGEDAVKKGGGEPKKDERKVTAKTKLSRSDVQKGMRSATARVAACYERFKVPGTVKVKVAIANTGVVTTASATGKFANTDTGACVAKAISQVSFPEFSGPPMSLTYPFLLQ